MSQLIDTLADVVFQVADMTAHPRSAKQLVATVFVTFASFFAIAAVVTLALGRPLPVGGLAVILPTVFFLTAIAVYCLWTDRGER